MSLLQDYRDAKARAQRANKQYESASELLTQLAQQLAQEAQRERELLHLLISELGAPLQWYQQGF